MKKIDGDLEFCVSFQSSHYNQAFDPPDLAKGYGSVSLDMYASVSSQSLAEWRAARDQPLRENGYVVGGPIGNLREKHKWIEFDLANPRARHQVIQEIIDHIREIGFPCFETFRDPQAVIAKLIAGTIPWMDWESDVLEYILCFGTRAQADEIFGRFRDKRPLQMDEYLSKLDEYRMWGIPNTLNARREPRLARAALALGFER